MQQMMHAEFSVMAFYNALFELSLHLEIIFLLQHNISRAYCASYDTIMKLSWKMNQGDISGI